MPKDWKDFSLAEQRQATASLMRGGMAPVGFAILEKGWLKKVDEMGPGLQAGLKETHALEVLEKISINE